MIICDAEMAHDVFYKQNKKVTKTGHISQMFEDFGGRPFAFEPSNDHWRKIRNQFSDVFHKYKIENVLKIVKE